MDKRVFITLLGLIILIGSVIGIKMLLADNCETPEISFEPASPKVGQMVRFVCANAEDNIIWNFDDGKESSGNNVEHRFDSVRSYSVKAVVNDKCENIKEVFIAAVPEMKTVIPTIILPSKIYAGQPAKFTEETPDASKWEWKVEETGETFSGLSFTPDFKKPGNYSVSVSVSGDYVKGDTAFIVSVEKPPVDPNIALMEKRKREEAERNQKEVERKQKEAERNREEAAKIAEAKRMKAEADRDKAEARKADAERIKTEAAEKKAEADRIKKEKAELKAEEERRKREAEAKRFVPDQDFKNTFRELANELHDGSNETVSDEWVDRILTQGCPNIPISVEMTDEGNEKEIITIERFKRYMMNKQYTVTEIQTVERGKNRCVLKIKLKVVTNIKRG